MPAAGFAALMGQSLGMNAAASAGSSDGSIYLFRIIPLELSSLVVFFSGWVS